MVLVEYKLKTDINEKETFKSNFKNTSTQKIEFFDTTVTLLAYFLYNSNKSFTLTQNTPVKIHFDSESVNPNFGQLKGHNSGVHGGNLAGYRTWSRYYAHQHIHQV